MIDGICSYFCFSKLSWEKKTTSTILIAIVKFKSCMGINSVENVKILLIIYKGAIAKIAVFLFFLYNNREIAKAIDIIDIKILDAFFPIDKESKNEL